MALIALDRCPALLRRSGLAYLFGFAAPLEIVHVIVATVSVFVIGCILRGRRRSMKGTSHQAMHTVKKLEDPDRHISILAGLGSRDYPFGGTESTHAAHLRHALPPFENRVANFTGKSIRTTHPLFKMFRRKSEEGHWTCHGGGFPFRKRCALLIIAAAAAAAAAAQEGCLQDGFASLFAFRNRDRQMPPDNLPTRQFFQINSFQRKLPFHLEPPAAAS